MAQSGTEEGAPHPSAYRLFWVLLVSGLSLSARPAVATVVRWLPVDEMARRAEVVVVGRVESTGSQAVRAGGRFVARTVTTVRVERWLKGLGGPVLRIDHRGGSVAGRTTVVVGTPRFFRGERVLLFLRRDQYGALTTLGLGLGKLSIAADPAGGAEVVERDLRGLESVEPSSHRILPSRIERADLAAVLRIVEGAVAEHAP